MCHPCKTDWLCVLARASPTRPGSTMAMVDAEKKPRNANSVQDGEVPGRSGDSKASGCSGEDDDAEDTKGEQHQWSK